MIERSRNYPNVSSRSKGNNKKEPFHEISRNLILEILNRSNSPLSRRELQIDLKKYYDRYAELGSFSAPLVYLEKEARISWVLMKCKFTGITVRHYYAVPSDLKLGTWLDYDPETREFIVRGKELDV